jgi:hypothetical protein
MRNADDVSCHQARFNSLTEAYRSAVAAASINDSIGVSNSATPRAKILRMS